MCLGGRGRGREGSLSADKVPLVAKEGVGTQKAFPITQVHLFGHTRSKGGVRWRGTFPCLNLQKEQNYRIFYSLATDHRILTNRLELIDLLLVCQPARIYIHWKK